jgi:non-ribosomal peptide synthetase component F
MTVMMREEGDEIRGEAEYRKEVYEEGRIERMMGHMRRVLEEVGEEVERRVMEVEMLSREEYNQVVLACNQTQANYPKHMCAHELIEEQVSKTPDAVAVSFGDQELSYGELNNRANQVAHYLRRIGVGPEDRVGVCLKPSLELVIGRLGVLKSGSAYVSLDPNQPAERLRLIVEDSRAGVMLTQDELVEQMTDCGIRVISPGGDNQQINAESKQNPTLISNAKNLAYVIYTSGSTGRPKGTEIGHTGLVNLIAWHIKTYEVNASERMSLLAGSGFDASVWELWPNMVAGASAHIPDENQQRKPDELVRWLEAKAITISFMATPLAEVVMQEKWPETVSLRRLLTGGDRLRTWPGEALKFEVANNYGPTEATVVTTWVELSGRAWT